MKLYAMPLLLLLFIMLDASFNYQTRLHATQPVTLSYCIAELKFTDDEIKICEFGPCPSSSFWKKAKIDYQNLSASFTLAAPQDSAKIFALMQTKLPPFFAKIMKSTIKGPLCATP